MRATGDRGEGGKTAELTSTDAVADEHGGRLRSSSWCSGGRGGRASSSWYSGGRGGGRARGGSGCGREVADEHGGRHGGRAEGVEALARARSIGEEEGRAAHPSENA